MKWEKLNPYGDNVYDKYITIYEAESDISPLKITEYGHYNHENNYIDDDGNIIRDAWQKTNEYWVYKGFRITFEQRKYMDQTNDNVWILRRVPVSTDNKCFRDKIFHSLEDVVRFVDKLFLQASKTK